jgi:hypothetical protein
MYLSGCARTRREAELPGRAFPSGAWERGRDVRVKPQAAAEGHFSSFVPMHHRYDLPLMKIRPFDTAGVV